MANGSIMNLWSNVTDVIIQPVVAPGWANLGLAYAYSVALINETGTAIDAGTVTLEGADALPDNWCEPDVFAPLDPVQDCGPIVTGVPSVAPVHYEITPERPIPAHGSCNIAAPCPKQFLQVSGLPAGVIAVVALTRLRRHDPTPAEWGYIPQPLPQPFMAHMAAAPQQAPSQVSARTAPQAQPQQQPPRPARPAPSPRPAE